MRMRHTNQAPARAEHGLLPAPAKGDEAVPIRRRVSIRQMFLDTFEQCLNAMKNLVYFGKHQER